MTRPRVRKEQRRAATPTGPESAPPNPVAIPASRAWLLSTSLALVVVNLWVYAAVRQHGFVAFDDPQYVSTNRQVNTGLTLENIVWAFQSGEQGNWHPLTWMSHMTDVELFGLEAGWHHLTSVAIHILTTLLLLVLLLLLTGARWRSALVAALFAVHPMHVESVAWIAERKDVLSALFWTGTLLAYVAYVREPGRRRYAAVVALFAAGLMSKPMVVTLPCVLLLLDMWPLGRVEPSGRLSAWWPLVREKLPLFAMTAAASLVTFSVQRASGAVRTLEALSLLERLQIAAVGYQTYIARLFWPHDMAVLYPFPESISTTHTATATVGLLALTWLAVRERRRRPWFLVGWFWFLGTLVPVSGLVQVGSQPFADRFTYIPYTGLLVVLVWGAAELARRPAARAIAAVTAALVLVALTTSAQAQVQVWRDGVTLWTHALSVTERNYRAHSALGFALAAEGRDAEAAAQYELALAIRPTYVEALSNLGGLRAEAGDLDTAAAHLSAALAVVPDSAPALANLGGIRARQGRFEEARSLFGRARQLEPESAMVRSGLGYALVLEGRLDEARSEIAEAIRLEPSLAEAHSNLGLVLGDQGDLPGAEAAFRQALTLAPGHARSHYGLGAVLDNGGRLGEAVVELRAAVDQDPDLAEAHNRLGRVLVKLGRLDESIPAFEAAVRARPVEPDFHYDLGVMLLKADRLDEALRQFEETLRLEPDHADTMAVMRALGRIR